jgi:hypothetical protein
MNKYIFTFGCGHPVYAGKYQIVIASNYDTARKVMFGAYGSHWGFQYTEEEWNEAIEKSEGRYPIETPLSTILYEPCCETIESVFNEEG